MFTPEERAKFPYWFAHWCAFNMTALNLRCWKFRFLFHDIWKPWLRLFLPYEKVQQIHRTHARHHKEYRGKRYDWLGMVIDWECSQYTKAVATMNARQKMENYKDKNPVFYAQLKQHLEPILEQLGL
ncbi:MAG: hypothetical protein IJT04_01975 [Bacteroidales bacterium]|jgi:hypothetical protein|nr:hypothetical protein [Bacteroidales bacterium]